MQALNITSETTTTVKALYGDGGGVRSIRLTNTHASTAVVVELYTQGDTPLIEILSTLVDLPEPGIVSAAGRFDALTNVEVGDEIVFYEPTAIGTSELFQISSPITVTSLTSITACEFSSIVIAPDNAVAKFYQLEKTYILKTSIPASTSLLLDEGISFNNKTHALKLKTTGAGLAISTPLSVIIK